MSHNDVLLTVLFLESALLNVGYRKEQSLAPFYFLFILMTCQTALLRASLECMPMTPTLLMLALM